MRLRLGVGGKVGPFRAGISTRGVGAGAGPLSAGHGWRRRRGSNQSSGIGCAVVLLLVVIGLIITGVQWVIRQIDPPKPTAYTVKVYALDRTCWRLSISSKSNGDPSLVMPVSKCGDGKVRVLTTDSHVEGEVDVTKGDTMVVVLNSQGKIVSNDDDDSLDSPNFLDAYPTGSADRGGQLAFAKQLGSDAYTLSCSRRLSQALQGQSESAAWQKAYLKGCKSF